MDPNSHEALLRRRAAAKLTWRGPAPMPFPFVWGLTEQMTYNGYLVPRLQVLCRSTSVAIAVVASPGPCNTLSCRWPSTRSSWCFGCCRLCLFRFLRRSCICGYAGWCRSRLRTPSWMGSVLIGVLLPLGGPEEPLPQRVWRRSGASIGTVW